MSWFLDIHEHVQEYQVQGQFLQKGGDCDLRQKRLFLHKGEYGGWTSTDGSIRRKKQVRNDDHGILIHLKIGSLF
jgi:hypothetical protein